MGICVSHRSAADERQEKRIQGAVVAEDYQLAADLKKQLKAQQEARQQALLKRKSTPSERDRSATFKLATHPVTDELSHLTPPPHHRDFRNVSHAHILASKSKFLLQCRNLTGTRLGVTADGKLNLGYGSDRLFWWTLVPDSLGHGTHYLEANGNYLSMDREGRVSLIQKIAHSAEWKVDCVENEWTSFVNLNAMERLQVLAADDGEAIVTSTDRDERDSSSCFHVIDLDPHDKGEPDLAAAAEYVLQQSAQRQAQIESNLQTARELETAAPDMKSTSEMVKRQVQETPWYLPS